MNYMLLIYQEENSLPEHERVADGSERPCEGIVERLKATGQYVAAGILQPTACATSVRLREGKRLLTDGPFAETREQLAGYLLIDAPDLDAAITAAVQHPIVRTGTVEIRPVREIPFLVPSSPASKA